MYLTPNENMWACDIEADNLLDKATKIHCVCVENCVTGEKHAFREAAVFIDWMANHRMAIYVGHNFIAYDAVMLNRFWGAGISITKIVDTFVLSQVYHPSYPKPKGLKGKKGPHSLEAWGIRLRFPKTECEDFSVCTPEMIEYCGNDTALTALLFRKLSERMRQVGFSEDGLRIEHLAWNIIQNKQRRVGFPFNQKKAMELYVELRALQEELQDDIYKLWPPKLQVVGSYKSCRKQDGEYNKQYLGHSGQYPKLVEHSDGSYDAYDYVSFNLGSPDQRIAKLLELGWKPVSFTKKTPKGGGGNPQVDEDSLLAFAEASGLPEVGKLAKWIVVYSRANMIGTWLDAYDEKTGAIHGKLFIASTLRYRHTNPNSANIPAVRTKKDKDGNDQILYGAEGAWAYECRELFWAGEDEDWVLVGLDGTGIQNRCLIHGLIKTVGEEPVAPFKELSLKGDVHKRNIEVLGLANKAAAKKFYYCVPLDSRALTKKGWRGHDEVEVGELVLTYNAKTDRQEWQPVLEKVYFDDAPVVEMGTKTFKVRSTPNHRWFVQQRKARTKWVDTPVEVRTTEELTTMQNIIVNAPLSPAFHGCSADNPMLHNKYGTNWVQKILDMSQQEREAFLAGFCIADGYQDGNGDWRWSQLRGELFDAALMASYLVHDGVLRVSNRIQENGNEIGTVVLGKKPHVTTASFEYKECANQPVWCIRTENESWVMKQGDVITVTGNTLMMGGGGARLAADQVQFGTHMTAKEGDKKKDAMIASIPGFGLLIKALQKELSETGRIKLCDGTPIVVTSPHMVIPYLLQGDESRLMKLAMIYVDEEIRRHHWTNDVFKVADIHDEWQYKVRKKYAEAFIDVALPCFTQAGEHFGYNIIIEGDAKIGRNWACTH